jgi:hypothetical protein
MAYTVEQLDMLKAAIAQGALTVKYSDKEVTYRSLDEMMRIAKIMDKEVNPPASNTSTRRYAEFSKGL